MVLFTLNNLKTPIHKMKIDDTIRIIPNDFNSLKRSSFMMVIPVPKMTKKVLK
jgi:hypothetical protein